MKRKVYSGKITNSLLLRHRKAALVDNAEQFRLKLLLNPTLDLEMELLSYGENLKVLEPKSLVEKIKKRLDDTLGRYE